MGKSAYLARSASGNRRTGNPDMPSVKRFRLAGWDVDPAVNRVSRGTQAVRLEPKVMEVLVYLSRRPEQLVTRAELEDAVWAETVVGYDSVTGTIQKLRKAFGDNARKPHIIETVPKRGYRLVAAVSRAENAFPAKSRPLDAGAAATGKPARMSGLRAGLLLVAVFAVIAVAVLVFQGNPSQ